MPCYRVTTLGCKINQYESQQIVRALRGLGLAEQPTGAPDLWVVNTCSVTGPAGRKSRQQIRRAAAQGRTTVIVVGCYATSDADAVRAIPGVDLVVGHGRDALQEIQAFVRKLLLSRATGGDRTKTNTTNTLPLIEAWPHAGAAQSQPADNAVPLGIQRFEGRQRALLKVQDGCDAFCSYCIVPRLRRQMVSKPIPQAVAEAETLVAAGHREIVVTGIFLGAYGRPTARRARWNRRPATGLPDLIAALTRIKGLARLRLSSLEPGDLTDELIEMLAGNPVWAPHLHLPLQSGSDAVLARMNRQYRSADYLDMLDRIDRSFDRVALTTDVIVGFPGETEDDFQKTLRICRRAGFCKIHGFPFSPRPGTAAARWKRDFRPSTVIRDRMTALGDLEAETSLSFRRQFLGEVASVLVESPVRSNGRPALLQGRTDRYFQVIFRGPETLVGKIVPVRIERLAAGKTFGRLLSESAGRSGSSGGRGDGHHRPEVISDAGPIVRLEPSPIG